MRNSRPDAEPLRCMVETPSCVLQVPTGKRQVPSSAARCVAGMPNLFGQSSSKHGIYGTTVSQLAILPRLEPTLSRGPLWALRARLRRGYPSKQSFSGASVPGLKHTLSRGPLWALRARLRRGYPSKQSFSGASVPGLKHTLSPRGVCSRILHFRGFARISLLPGHSAPNNLKVV